MENIAHSQTCFGMTLSDAVIINIHNIAYNKINIITFCFLHYYFDFPLNKNDITRGIASCNIIFLVQYNDIAIT